MHGTLQERGWIATFFVWTGVLGVGRYTVNSPDRHVRRHTGERHRGRQPSITAFMLDIHVQLFDSRAIVRSGTQINQDPIFAATEAQSVEVSAKTDIVQVAVTGGSDLEKIGRRLPCRVGLPDQVPWPVLAPADPHHLVRGRRHAQRAVLKTATVALIERTWRSTSGLRAGSTSTRTKTCSG